MNCQCPQIAFIKRLNGSWALPCHIFLFMVASIEIEHTFTNLDFLSFVDFYQLVYS